MPGCLPFPAPGWSRTERHWLFRLSADGDRTGRRGGDRETRRALLRSYGCLCPRAQEATVPSRDRTSAAHPLAEVAGLRGTHATSEDRILFRKVRHMAEPASYPGRLPPLSSSPTRRCRRCATRGLGVARRRDEGCPCRVCGGDP